MLFFTAGSVIALAWRTMTEEWESTSRQIKANAEALESRALDRLVTLMTERRKARKVYQEDHTKISSQFTQVRLNYQKMARDSIDSGLGICYNQK